MTKFSELGLAAPIEQALTEEGYETPTPIQMQAIPALLKGADLLGIAQTGTGKTAAFALPLLTRLFADYSPAPRRSARVLVLAPTRELAAQIGASFRTYGRHLGVRVAVVFGGVAHRPQIEQMAPGVDVLVATPGRLIDHMETGAISLQGVTALVLDEADQMLDLGFVRPIRRIVSKLPAKRQNLFFSATMPHEIAALAAELLHDPVRVQVTPVATTAERVSQRVIHIEANKKRPLLVELLAAPEMSRTLVFTRTKRGADRVARHLEENSITAAAIHGNKSQKQREVALEAFRNGRTAVLVATDIAARGIDIDGVTHVVNYELPEVPEAYVHRIGRTARAGAEGDAISLCDVEERDLLRAIERLTRQSIPAEDRRNDPSIAAVSLRGSGPERRGHGNERGRERDAGDRGAEGRRNGEARGNGEARRGRGRDGDRRIGDGRRQGEGRNHVEGRSSGESRRKGDRQRHEARADAGGGAARGASAARGSAAAHGGHEDRTQRGRHGDRHRDARPERLREGERMHQNDRRDTHGASAPTKHRNGEARAARGGAPDGASVAHVFENGFGKPRSRGDRDQTRTAGNGGQRGGHANSGNGKSHNGAHAGKPRRGGGGGNGNGGGHRGAHRGAGARRALVEA